MDCQDVRLWKDALTSYSGEKFDMIWKDSLNVVHHVYSKEYRKKMMKVRKEIQEYLNSSFKDAFMDKLKDNNDNRDKTFLVELL